MALWLDAPHSVTVYQYENHSIEGWSSQLWVADTGKVMYVDISGHTEWHGNFTEMLFDMASLTFQHTVLMPFDMYGEEDILKHVVLCKTQTGWRGVDCANCQITLTRLTRLQSLNDSWYPALFHPVV